ncbi:MAG TPA: preprotein translocase subunit Tim44 [Planctomycetaceae bacterium]|jgi:indolepyruvate decarboxylase|nr:preprotein translocase subunit Tim44 [Rhodopirellula sp.]HCK70492.1 preprotein translocase subunit Tim44 [Planctomycetaceae bacterium]HCP83225.1 preprotein translocase subunit Tim44 [Planctomycetaceae bacterium]|tara:strand:+ start:13289 stop:14983 length:1695 start_codon:yes stop_codon:yes gene_type:complete
MANVKPASTASETHLGSTPVSVGEYLIRRLQDYGISDLFGIPGDYVLSLYSMLEDSEINVVGCTREDCAGFAADAYARVHGMGAVCVTYCVGGLSVCNAIAGAFAEKSPVVLITGSPGMNERLNNPLLHHKVRDFRTQIDVLDKLCITGAELSDPINAFREINRVLDAAYRYKRPVYLDLPRNIVNVVPQLTHPYHQVDATASEEVVNEAADEIVHAIESAKRPLILAGVEIHRFGLQDYVLQFAEQTGIPVASTMLGKSVIRETHPLYVGLYEGALGHDAVTEFVESSDLILMLGTFMTDINMGINSASLDNARCINITSEQLQIKNHFYHDVALKDLMEAIISRPVFAQRRRIPDRLTITSPTIQVEDSRPIEISRMVTMLNEQLDSNTMVIADIGDSLFAATDLVTQGRTEFISPAYYTSMGFSVPAALGAQVARPDQRVVVLCGDGAFQMTGMELSTIVRNGYAPIVFVLDNGGYGTERVLHPGSWEYNEIHSWDYSKIPQVLRGGTGYEVHTEGDLADVLEKAWNDRDGLSLVHVHLSRNDMSRTLKRLGERMRPTVGG